MLALLVGLSAVPVTYACYNGGFSWPPSTYCCPTTPDCDTLFEWAVSNDDGNENMNIDPGDDGGGTEYDRWGALSSDDPSAPQVYGSEADRYTKDVAKTTARINCCDDHYLYVTLDNAYPSYYPTVFFSLENTGTLASQITAIEIDEDPSDEDPDDIPEITVTLDGVSLYQVIPSGGSITGRLAIHVEQCALQNWTYNLKIRIQTDCTEEEPECETAFAHACCLSHCFDEWGFSNWGWTNGKLWPCHNYYFTLYAGAAHCNPLPEKKVGKVFVQYHSSYITVYYQLDPGYRLEETHLYIGSEPLPTKNGSYTVAPGQYTYQHTGLDSGWDWYSVPASGPVWMIAHAVVCPDQSPPTTPTWTPTPTPTCTPTPTPTCTPTPTPTYRPWPWRR